MIRIIEMVALHDDVSINNLFTIVEQVDKVTLQDLYKYVRNIACKQAEDALLNSQGRKQYLVEMGENEEGLPHASMYINNVIERQIFATRN